MWKSISLRLRIYAMLAVLVVITLAGGLIMIWYTFRMETLLDVIINRNVAAFQAAEALETALVNQKGFVSYYFLDKNPDWLRQLGEYRQVFRDRLKEAMELVDTEDQRKAIDTIDSEYHEYVAAKDQVIAYYKSGKKKMGSSLHKEVREQFFRILNLCESYKQLLLEKMNAARFASQAEAKKIRLMAVTAIFMVLLMALLLLFVLVTHILDPVRRLAQETDRHRLAGKSGDEVRALSEHVRGLIEDVDTKQSELERSRETLLQSEKMALVGRLAAGTAHSIRNPLTSVKMRLFSLSRTLEMSSTQKEDFDVISDEIRHIDTIVENFLEFARPPKLKMQEVSPSEVVDLAVQLLKHRLESYMVDVKILRGSPLPPIPVDPEQLKEVMVNLIVNACEAMENGGQIAIREKLEPVESHLRKVVIQIEDNGPGIPQSLADKVFEPFFTTKEEGTGLGLSICSRIIEQHGGRLDLESKVGEGTTFTILLPIKEPNSGNHSDHRR